MRPRYHKVQGVGHSARCFRFQIEPQLRVGQRFQIFRHVCVVLGFEVEFWFEFHVLGY